MTTFTARLIRLAVLAMVLSLGLSTANAAPTNEKSTTTRLGASASSTTCEVVGDTTSCEVTSVGVSFTSTDTILLCVFIQRYGFVGSDYFSGTNELSCTTRATSIFELDKKIETATLHPQTMQLTPQCSDIGEECPPEVIGRTITVGATWTGVGEIEQRKANDKTVSGDCTYLFHSKGFHRQATTSIVLNGATMTGYGGIYGSDEAMTVKCK